MIDIPNSVKELFKENYRQLVYIEFDNGDDTIVLTEKNIEQGSFAWDRYCATGEMLEIGSAASAEIEFTLRNDDGYFLNTAGEEVPVEDITFEGKELTVRIGVTDGSVENMVDIGKFTIMSMPHKFSTINISALDRMTWFDLYVLTESNPFNRLETVQTIVQKMCQALSIPYTFDNTLPNADLEVDTSQFFGEGQQTTFRQILQWVAAITGTCAYIDIDGALGFKWLTVAEGVTITPYERYSSQVYEPVVFTGLTVQKNDETYHVGADGNYDFSILDNGLIQGSLTDDKNLEAINNVWNALSETANPYRPFEASTVPLPYLEPLDIVSYTDNNGNVFDTLITHVTFEINGATSLKAVGISNTEAQIVGPGGQTPQAKAEIEDLKNKIALLENATAAARASLTEMVKMALGLHQITVTTDSGAIYYFTTANVPGENPTLEDLGAVITPNDVIYQLSGAGVAWCYGSDWNAQAQEPTDGWRYGITKNGTAILSVVNTEGIVVSNDSVYKTAITPDSYNVYQGANLVFGLSGQLESQINRLLVKSNIENPELENNAYIRLGSAMLVPADGGLDIVYVEDI